MLVWLAEPLSLYHLQFEFNSPCRLMSRLVEQEPHDFSHTLENTHRRLEWNPTYSYRLDRFGSHREFTFMEDFHSKLQRLWLYTHSHRLSLQPLSLSCVYLARASPQYSRFISSRLWGSFYIVAMCGIVPEREGDEFIQDYFAICEYSHWDCRSIVGDDDDDNDLTSKWGGMYRKPGYTC